VHVRVCPAAAAADADDDDDDDDSARYAGLFYV